MEFGRVQLAKVLINGGADLNRSGGPLVLLPMGCEAENDKMGEPFSIAERDTLAGAAQGLRSISTRNRWLDTGGWTKHSAVDGRGSTSTQTRQYLEQRYPAYR